MGGLRWALIYTEYGRRKHKYRQAQNGIGLVTGVPGTHTKVQPGLSLRCWVSGSGMGHMSLFRSAR